MDRTARTDPRAHGCGAAKPAAQHADEAIPVVKQAGKALRLAEEEVASVVGADESALTRLVKGVEHYKEQDIITTCGDVRDAVGRLEDSTGQDFGELLQQAAALSD